MSKKILVFAVLFTIALSMTISQEASALTKGRGDYSRTTASLDPSRVCGNHVCMPGEGSKWFHAVSISQRLGPGKATGGYLGHVIMHQLVVNSQVKQTKSTIEMTSIKSGKPTSDKIGMSDNNSVMKNMPMNNQANTTPMNNQTNTSTNSTG
ncbi:MAG: hypothetical protein KGI28_06550 [Thaumarchaeota archaeon]|nr:hypothetical protein [Nitrososphaerota archaeon]